MSGNFVSELIKAAVIDLLFKRPIQVQYARDPAGKVEFRASINPSSGGPQQQQPVVYMAQQPYGYPPPYPPGYPGAYPPGYQFQQPPQPGTSGAPSQPQPQDRPMTAFDAQIPTTFRR